MDLRLLPLYNMPTSYVPRLFESTAQSSASPSHGRVLMLLHSSIVVMVYVDGSRLNSDGYYSNQVERIDLPGGASILSYSSSSSEILGGGISNSFLDLL